MSVLQGNVRLGWQYLSGLKHSSLLPASVNYLLKCFIALGKGGVDTGEKNLEQKGEI
jgi:hypothetical protein